MKIVLPNGNKYEIDYMYGQIYWFVFTEIDGKISEEQKVRKEFFSRKNPILAVKNDEELLYYCIAVF